MDTTQLQKEIEILRDEVRGLNRRISEHSHTGTLDQRIDILDLVGMIPVVSVAPTHSPRDFQEQFCIYKSGTTSRFYWYDWNNKEWKYTGGVAGLTGTKVYYVADTSGGAVTRKLTFTDGVLTAET